MKYIVTIAGRSVAVEVDGDRVAVDGETVAAHLAAVPGTPLVHLLLGAASWTVAAEPLEGPGPEARWALGIAGERVAVAVVDERTRALQTLTARPDASGGETTVRAPMPGLVVRVAVAPGQRVERGTGLIVVEAMKMENELRAPVGGVVQLVHVEVGVAVEQGAPLVTLGRPEPAR
jgi:biotin carboxyl carrier protein